MVGAKAAHCANRIGPKTVLLHKARPSLASDHELAELRAVDGSARPHHRGKSCGIRAATTGAASCRPHSHVVCRVQPQADCRPPGLITPDIGHAIRWSSRDRRSSRGLPIPTAIPA